MTRWTPTTVGAWARRHLTEPFTQRDVCAAARASTGIPGDWSRGLGILAALRRFLLVERIARPCDFGRRQTFEYRFKGGFMERTEAATCRQLADKVMTTEDWLAKHRGHGNLTDEPFPHPSGTWRQLVCDCGAKHLTDIGVQTMGDRTRGVYHKFNVTRTDGKSAPGEKHDGCWTSRTTRTRDRR